MIIKNSIFLIVLGFLFAFKTSFALTFEIVQKEPVPQTIPEFGKTSAFYTITNATNTELIGNFVKTLPPHVTQVTCNPNYCGKTFNLGPNGSSTDSCVLKLTIKAPVNASPSDLLVCKQDGVICDAADTPLKITLGAPVAFIGTGAGSYSNHTNGIFPLLAATNDSGNTWTYPKTIFQNLQNEIDPNFQNGVLSGAACSGSADKAICIAPGQWCPGAFCDGALPLIAVGTKNATQWSYPKSVFQNLNTVIDPDFTRGELRSGSCFGSGGSSVCIASGTFDTTTTFLPLLARSGDGGKSWTYPPSIFKNPKITIDPSFENGLLFSASCTENTCDSVCITAGTFNDSTLPLIGVSRDKGLTWSYPSYIFKNLDIKLEPTVRDAYLSRASCTGVGNEARCIGVGFFSTNTNTLPLLALTQNGGQTWSYPPSIFKNLDTTIGHGFVSAFFNAASCSGVGSKSICVGAGSYATKGSGFPVLTVSRDGGNTWTYPDFIYTKLKTIVDPEAIGGTFEGASCTGTGKKGICIAAGEYCRKGGICFPLIAVSNNGGKSWSYPSTVYQNLTSTIDPNFKNGYFNNASCSGSVDYSFCIAAGQYYNGSESFPLLAYSIDNGNTWTYPPSIFKNLDTIIDPDYASGQFNNVATTGGEIISNIYQIIKNLVSKGGRE